MGKGERKKDMWESHVILDNVVHWGECGQQLHLETKDGKRYGSSLRTAVPSASWSSGCSG